ncbi:hypothetical protein SAVCW2_08290 [Streptomyces avermitilis]|uniref:Uncharacterized protein n=1 Tax=Streptomyces avermitilis TaxID=33903 RepID=A0A4D4MK70_STRAX|nr:hypothetical protein SAV31267_019770 [Streptomyces avermitilis]GDY81630.1 hypothetical protein SAVCW2_08290 [Streptomyces avermitilis]
MQIRVADPAGLDGDEHLARAGIGDDDRLHLDGCALFDSDYGTDLVWHDQAPLLLRNARWVAR